MSDDTTIPPPAPITPHLVVAGAAEAIDFYVQAFGATELVRLPGPDGKLVHAAVSINGGVVMLVDENEEWGLRGPTAIGGTPVTIHLTVPDVDAFVATAVAAGATVTMPVELAFWGDRYGQLADPFGHQWSVATPQPGAPRTAAELQAAMAHGGAPA